MAINPTVESPKRQAATCFTKEQTEALKQIAGIDEYYPNFWEVQQAGKIFKARLAAFSQDIANGETTMETAINSAAAAVWSQARRYQSEKQAAQTAAIIMICRATKRSGETLFGVSPSYNYEKAIRRQRPPDRLLIGQIFANARRILRQNNPSLP